MLTCKQVSKTLSEEDYAALPARKRFFLKMHVFLCVFCGKFNRQVMLMQDTIRGYKKREEAEVENRLCMDEEQKKKLREALKKKAS